MAGVTRAVIGTHLTATEPGSKASSAITAAEMRSIIEPGVEESNTLLGSMDVALASIKLGMQIGTEEDLEVDG